MTHRRRNAELNITDEDVLERFPSEQIDQDNIDFYRGLLHHELRLNLCADCGQWHHPPRAFCPACWSANVQATPIDGRGTVYLLIFLHLGSPIEGVDYAKGHPVATVAFDDQPGLRFTATLVDCEREEMKIGLPVELTWIEREGEPVPAFRPRGGDS
jgi:uncharacterized OB-fold protein